MASLHDSLTIARSAILTHQERMAVISHNIANVNTPGYHRQRAVLGTNPPINPTIAETRHWDTGTGVTIIDVIRQYDNMQESLLIGQNGDAAYNDTLANGLANLESLVAGIGDAGLTDSLQSFWNAWQDVANNADVVAFRNVLIEKSITLTNQINTIAQRMDNFRNQIASGTPPNTTGIIQDQVDEVNTLAEQISELNNKISYNISGFEPYSLQDRRTDLIRQLSELVDISVSSDFTITIDGQTLVNADGSVLNTLEVADTASPVSLTLDGSAVTVDSGSIGAWIDVASTIDSATGSLSQRLDILADTLFNEVNALHSTGYDLNGNNDPLNLFFTGSDNNGDGYIDADTLTVNSSIYDSSNPLNNHPELIQAAATRYSAGPPPVPNTEDGAIALQIAALASTTPAALNSMHFHEFIPDALATIGARIDTARTMADENEAIISALNDAIQQATGVNLDEELIDMLSAQRAYQAASKLFTIIDEMLLTTINLGR